MLELSPDAKHVRRIIPIPDYDIVEIQKRMLLVENLPPAPTIGEWMDSWRRRETGLLLTLYTGLACRVCDEYVC